MSDGAGGDVMGILRARGLRMTPQRRAIVAEIMRTRGHISPTALARKVQGEMPGVNASTVYRTLALLEEVGVLSHAHLEGGAEYHRAEEAGHVHLTCSRCGA
ncbi:MAG TPA: transcriptional repressor, partial [Actinomycetota bacterium]